MNLSFALALWAAFDTRAAVIDFLITLGLTIYLAQSTLLTISLENDWLYVGGAKIESKFIESIDVLDKSEISLLRTQHADPNAYLDLRFWVPRGIKINLNDSRDYTPYWLVSTNNGAKIKEALRK